VFGSKVSIAITRHTGIIIGALSFSNNPYDGHALDAARGLSGTGCVRGTNILTPGFSQKSLAAAKRIASGKDLKEELL
jgi:hypothetical protein